MQWHPLFWDTPSAWTRELSELLLAGTVRVNLRSLHRSRWDLYGAERHALHDDMIDDTSFWQDNSHRMQYCSTYNWHQSCILLICTMEKNKHESSWIYPIPTQLPLSLAIKKPLSRRVPGLWSCSDWAAMISSTAQFQIPLGAFRKSDVCGIAKPLRSSLVFLGSLGETDANSDNTDITWYIWYITL